MTPRCWARMTRARGAEGSRARRVVELRPRQSAGRAGCVVRGRADRAARRRPAPGRAARRPGAAARRAQPAERRRGLRHRRRCGDLARGDARGDPRLSRRGTSAGVGAARTRRRLVQRLDCHHAGTRPGRAAFVPRADRASGGWARQGPALERVGRSRDPARRPPGPVRRGGAQDRRGAGRFQGRERPLTTDVCAGLDQAVQAAAERAAPGDVVLLSPGGTSYDEFVDFAARGERFRELVAAL